MKHHFPNATQFYITQPQPCPYLAGRIERKMFTNLDRASAVALNNTLTKQGFRRSQSVLYRPSCQGCRACLSVRVRVADFTPRASHRRILRKNADLQRTISPPKAQPAHYHIFKDYLDGRHSGGGMTAMGFMDFLTMVEDTALATRVVDYRPHSAAAPIAACLSDALDDGLSMIYSFFEPSVAGRSMGIYMILDHINMAIERGLDYVYLGYWVPKSRKMHYKSGFAPLEVYRDGAWRDLGDPNAVRLDELVGDAGLARSAEETLPEQVAQLRLPEGLRISD